MALRYLLKKLANIEQKHATKELKKYGLLIDDTINLYGKETSFNEAVQRLPHAEYLARLRRLKRATDLDAKHVEMPEEFQHSWDPNKPYLAFGAARAKKMSLDAAAQDLHKPRSF